MTRSRAVGLLALTTATLALATPAAAADVPADPSNYRDILPTLLPGDTMVLAPGSYTRLTIDGIHGTADAWITITGPDSGDPAVILGESCCNTVQLYDASYVAVRNLTIDAQGLYVDAVNAKGSPSHHILIENNTMLGFPADEQQIVGVNTKTTVWNWTIRGNRILEAGTGIYLGGSEGDTPFIAGVIENNLILHPSGYCMQVKHQNDYTPTGDMPTGPNRTIIRHNVFIKDDRDSPSGDRPNLLVGGFPDTGTGTDDIYEIYGNFLFNNPREALFQATGRMSIHDNLFVAAPASGYPTLAITAHQGKTVKLAHVYNNTFYTTGTAVAFNQAASQSDALVGNLMFAATAFSGTVTDERDNLSVPVADAANYVNAPGQTLGTLDFYPLPGAVEGSPLDLTKFGDDVADLVDFNGDDKSEGTFRGAYAGAGDNPCGLLSEQLKTCAPSGDDSGDGTDGGMTSGDTAGGGGGVSGSASAGGGSSEGGNLTTDGGVTAGSSAGAATAGPGQNDDESTNSGCGCTTTHENSGAHLGLLALGLLCHRRRNLH